MGVKITQEYFDALPEREQQKYIKKREQNARHHVKHAEKIKERKRLVNETPEAKEKARLYNEANRKKRQEQQTVRRHEKAKAKKEQKRLEQIQKLEAELEALKLDRDATVASQKLEMEAPTYEVPEPQTE